MQFDEDILCSILSHLPHDPAVLDSVAAMDHRVRYLLHTSSTMPKCAVSQDGLQITAIPHNDYVDLTYRPSHASGTSSLSSSSPSVPPRGERVLAIDGMGRLAGKEPFDKLVAEADMLKRAYGVATRVDSLRLAYCRRLLPQCIPKSFITALCCDSLTTLVIEGFPNKTIDAFIQQVVIACGSTLHTIDLSSNDSVNVSPATVAQIEQRCVGLRHLTVPTSSAFVACAVAKLLETHSHLHTIGWSGSPMTIVPAIARHAYGLRSLVSPTILWRSREHLPLVKLIIAHNAATLRELAVDCGAATSETGRYLASILVIGGGGGSGAPTPLAARLERVVYQEGRGVERGTSALRYFAHCGMLTRLDLSVDTLASLDVLPTGCRLRALRVTTNPSVLPTEQLLPARARFEAYLRHHKGSLEEVVLGLHAAYPELIRRALCAMEGLRRLDLEIECSDYRPKSVAEERFDDGCVLALARGVGHSLTHLSIKGYGDEGTSITDEALAHLVQHCRRLTALSLVGLRGAITDAGLEVFHNHSCPRTAPLFTLSTLHIGGEWARLSFDAAALLVRRIGGALKDLALSKLLVAPEEFDLNEATALDPMAAPLVAAALPPAEGAVRDGINTLLSACAEHCPDLERLAVGGAGMAPRIHPDAAALLEFKRGCRLATFISE